MKRTTKWYAWLGMIILALALAAALAPAAPAHAAPARSHTTNAISADTLTLSITNGTTFQLDAFPGPRVHLVLKLGTPWTGPNTLFTATVQMGDGQQYPNASFTGPAADGVTYTADVSGDRDTSGNLLTIGAHAATASFTNPATNSPTTSNTVNFTITPIYEGLMCGIGVAPLTNTNGVWKPGQSVTMGMQSENYDSNYPIDWTKGTATITLKGPKTVTYSNLSLDSNGATTITAPTTLGYYAMDCKVSGVPYYTFGETGFSSPSYLVSEQQALGGIKLYTNPTTVVAGKPIQMYIVFEAGPGLPTPTGQYTVYIGSGSQFYYTQSLKIASNGTASLSLAAIQNLYSANVITVTYWGDGYYKKESVNFPMTNPAIPGGTGGAGGGGTTPGQPTATPKPNATATAGATPTEGAGSGATSGPPAQAPTPTPGAGSSVLGAFGPFSGGGLIALLVVVALLALGGGVGTFVVLSRRGSAPAPHNPSDYPAQWPARSPLDVDTSPRLDTTRPEAPPWWRQDGGPYDGQR